MKNIFKKEIAKEVIDRIQKLSADSERAWGKMSAAQMLAHLNVQYEIIYESDKFPKPNAFVRFILKTFIKNKVVGPKPFPKNGKTAPYFVMDDAKDFEKEKSRLIAYITKTQENGVEVLLPRDTKSFGKLTADEWNNMFYKHLDHHLVQFNV